MTEPLNTSFIPKRNPNAPTRHNSTQRVFVGTLIIQIFFFSVLLASLGAFVYEKKLTKDRDVEIAKLNDSIKSFNEDRMKEVISVDNRINQVKYRLEHTASIYSVLEAMEAATVQVVQIKSLKLKRVDDSVLNMEAEMKADSFDSVLFQRGVLERDEKLSVANISDLKISNPTSKVDEDKKKSESGSEGFNITFKAELGINSQSVPHLPVMSQVSTEAESSANNSASATTDTGSNLDTEEVVNQENI